MFLLRSFLNTMKNQKSFSSEEIEKKLVKAVVIGAPNAGKSTLINTLIGKKIFPVSHKVHTTRQTGVGVFVDGPCQVVLLDTPGLIPYQYSRRLKMSKSFITGAQRSTEEANLIVAIVDVTNKRTRLKLDQNALDILKNHHAIPATLVLNKVDALHHKHILLDIVSSIIDDVKTNITDKYEFDKVFMISALSGNGVEDMKEYLLSSCTPLPWEYGANDNTDQSVETIVEEIIRERLFHYLDKEIPYIIKQSTVIWELNGETLKILKNLDCKKSSQASIVIGPKGTTIQAITSEAQELLQSILNYTIDLTLNVRSLHN